VKNPTVGRDDGLRPISSEEYVKFRLLPTVRMLELKIPRTQKVYALTQGLVLLCTMLASVCAVLGLQAFIPAIVSLVAAIEGSVQFDQTALKLVGQNNNLSQLQELRIWWQSLSMVQKTVPSNKEHLVETTEDAIEAEVGVWTAGIMRRSRRLDDENQDDDKKTQ
jgi:hypothetical protein